MVAQARLSRRRRRHRCGQPPLARVDARLLFDGMLPRKTGGNVMGSPRSEPGRDLLSALPDEVLHHVLSFLPAEEAVRTCVLAQRWRHLWMFATGLRISCSFKNKQDSMKVLREFVDHLLLLRGGSPLSTCELTLPHLVVDDMPRIKLWIRHLLMCKVQILRLSFDFYNSSVELDRLVSQHLNRLQLYDVQFNDNFLDFSGCPALEVLEIESCDFRYASRMLSKSLKYLSIDRWSYFCIDSRMHIYTPNLHSLRLEACNYRAPVLDRMPSLVEAILKFHDPEYDSCDPTNSGDCEYKDCFGCYGVDGDTNKCVLLQGLSEARSLVLISHVAIFIFRRDLKWCPVFANLKNLLLNEYWCVPSDFSALACILEHAPVLEKLTLQLYCAEAETKVEIKGSPDPAKRSTAISEHLKTGNQM